MKRKPFGAPEDIKISSVECMEEMETPNIFPRKGNIEKREYYLGSMKCKTLDVSHNSLRSKRSFKNAMKKLRIFKPGGYEDASDNSKINETVKNNVLSDIEKLMDEFSKSLNTEHDIKLLCNEILKNAVTTLNIDRCSIFLVEDNLEVDSKILVEFAFDVMSSPKSSTKSFANSSSTNFNSKSEYVKSKNISDLEDKCEIYYIFTLKLNSYVFKKWKK